MRRARNRNREFLTEFQQEAGTKRFIAGRPLRVLQLVRNLDVGGLERVVLALAYGLHKAGVEVYLGCVRDLGTWGRAITKSGTEQNPLFRDVWIGGLQNRTKLPVIIDLARFIRAQQIDLVHTHNPTPHWCGVAAACFTRRPVVHTKHGRNSPDNRKFVWLSRQLARRTAKIVAVSEDAAEVARTIERIPAHKILVVRNGVAGFPAQVVFGTPQNASDERLNACDRAGFIVGSVGRLSPVKNYPGLVRAFAHFLDMLSAEEISEKHPLLVLVGGGPDESRIRETARELGLEDHLLLAGEQQNVSAWLERMDVFCLSSNTEGTSMALLEAALAGLPLVVTDAGGNREIVADGRAGRLAPVGDMAAIASHLLELFRKKELRGTLGRRAREHVLRVYSYRSMVEKYLDVYSEALRGKTLGTER